MAEDRDPEKLAAQLRAGADASVLASLCEVNLRNARLRGANLRGANLRGADLRGANLRGANLQEADLREAKLIMAQLHWSNRRGADLRNAKLRGARLLMANLANANLRGADLQEADLTGANLVNSKLRGANLFTTNLPMARLFRAELHGADLRRANLGGADLRGANLRGANLGEANLRGATMTNLELPTSIADAQDVRFLTVDWRTVARSLHFAGLRDFLVRTGMPEVTAIYLIDSLRTIDEMDLFTMLQSTFISYGAPDEDFARKLRDELERHGVKTWFFPEDAVPGERLHRVMSRGVREHDRVILICSGASLTRAGVLNEIEQALAREASEGGTQIVIPVRLDDFLFTTGWAGTREDLREQLCNRVVADFRGTATDEKKFEVQLAKLVRALGPRKPAP